MIDGSNIFRTKTSEQEETRTNSKHGMESFFTESRSRKKKKKFKPTKLGNTDANLHMKKLREVIDLFLFHYDQRQWRVEESILKERKNL